MEKLKSVWKTKKYIIIGCFILLSFIGGSISPDSKESSQVAVQITPIPTKIENTPIPTPVDDKFISSSKKGEFAYFAQDVITKLLKSPSTAKFPGIIMDANQWKVTRNKELVEINSYVDSQNSFGAMIRTNFTVQAGYTKGDVLCVVMNDKVVFGELKKE